MIQTEVEMNPEYTVGTLMDHPLWSIDRRDSVDFVSGSTKLIHWRILCIPESIISCNVVIVSYIVDNNL